MSRGTFVHWGGAMSSCQVKETYAQTFVHMLGTGDLRTPRAINTKDRGTIYVTRVMICASSMLVSYGHTKSAIIIE